ncbi:hypothetical protein LPJ55_003706 [Coemansia sp. RSA 990]|nr:hypothetical protein LPJ55_003706 [Coemansia sp. RSA 990]
MAVVAENVASTPQTETRPPSTNSAAKHSIKTNNTSETSSKASSKANSKGAKSIHSVSKAVLCSVDAGTEESAAETTNATQDEDSEDRDEKHLNENLEQTIVASSLPAIGEHFESMNSIAWISTSFLLASTATQPLYGRLSDIFGRIETLIAGLVIFLVGSAISGAAQSMGMLIGGRVVQGLGASALISLVMVIVSDISIERERGKVASVFAAIWAASSVLGPVLGGVFTQSGGGWRWVFYFSLPVGGVSGIFILLFLHLPRPHDSFMQKLKRVDFAGMAVLIGGVVMVLLALEFGGREYGWSSVTVLCLLIFGVAVIAIFVLIEWKVPKEPIMPLRLFKNRNVGISLAQQIFMGAALFGPVFYTPIFFSVVKNSSAINAGLHLLPFLLPITIVSVITGFAVSKTGRYREFQWAGTAIVTVGLCLLMLFDEDVSTGKSIGILIVSGIGMGMLMQPFLLCLQTAILPRDIATGTTLFVATRSLGGAIGLSVFQTVQLNQLAKELEPVYVNYADYAAAIAETVQNQAIIHSSKIPDDLRTALIRANVISLRAAFYAMIPFGGAMFILSLFLKHIPLRTKMVKTHGNSNDLNNETSEKS